MKKVLRIVLGFVVLGASSVCAMQPGAEGDVFEEFEKHTEGAADTYQIGKRTAPIVLKELQKNSDAFKVAEKYLVDSQKLMFKDSQRVLFNFDGSKVAADLAGQTYLYNVQDQSRIGQPMEGWVSEFSSDGTKIVTCYDGISYLYSVQDQSRIGQPMEGCDAKFSSDGTKIVTSSEKGVKVHLYSVQNQSRIGQPMRGRNPQFSPDSTKLAIDTGSSIVFYSVEGGGRIGQRIDGRSPFLFSPNSTKMVVDSFDQGTGLYNVQDQSRIGQPIEGKDAKFSPDGTKIAVGSDDMSYLHNVQDGSRIGKSMQGYRPVFSPDGTKIAADKDDMSYLYNVQDQSRIGQSMEGSRSQFSPDGTKIATSYDDKMIYLYSTQDASRVRQSMRGFIFEFSPKSTHIVVWNFDDSYLCGFDWLNYLVNINSVKQLRLLEIFGLAIQESEGKTESKRSRIVLTGDQKETFKTLPKWMARALLPYVGAEIKSNLVLSGPATPQIEKKSGDMDDID